jgi:hypothetical protein
MESHPGLYFFWYIEDKDSYSDCNFTTLLVNSLSSSRLSFSINPIIDSKLRKTLLLIKPTRLNIKKLFKYL